MLGAYIYIYVYLYLFWGHVSISTKWYQTNRKHKPHGQVEGFRSAEVYLGSYAYRRTEAQAVHLGQFVQSVQLRSVLAVLVDYEPGHLI